MQSQGNDEAERTIKKSIFSAASVARYLRRKAQKSHFLEAGARGALVLGNLWLKHSKQYTLAKHLSHTQKISLVWTASVVHISRNALSKKKKKYIAAARWPAAAARSAAPPAA